LAEKKNGRPKIYFVFGHLNRLIVLGNKVMYRYCQIIYYPNTRVGTIDW